MPNITAGVKWADNTAELKRNLQDGLNSVSRTVSQVKSELKDAAQAIKDLEKAAAEFSSRGATVPPVLASDLEKAKTQAAGLKTELADLTDKTKPAADGLKDVGDQADKAGEKADKAQANLRQIATSLSTLGREMTAAVTVPVVAAAGASIKFATDFETNMTRVRTLAGASADEVARLRQQVLDLAPAVGIGPNELAKGLFVVETEGYRGAEAMDILTKGAKLSALGLGDMFTVTRTLVTTLKAFQQEGLTAAQASDILVATVQKGDIPIDSLAGALGRVNAAAAAMHVPFAEVGAAIATFTRVGVSASEAVTGLRGLLLGLEAPTNKTKQAFAQLTVNGQQLTPELVRQMITSQGLARTMVTLMDATHGNIEILRNLIPNVRAFTEALSNAKSQGTDYLKIADDIRHANGVMEDSFKTTTETTAFKWAQLRAELEKVAVDVGTDLLPQVKDLIDNVLKPGVHHIDEWVKAFQALPTPVKAFAEVMIGIGAAGGPVLLGLGAIARALAAIQVLLFGANAAAETSILSVLARYGLGAAAGLASPGGVAAAAAIEAPLAVYGSYKHRNDRPTQAQIEGAEGGGFGAVAPPIELPGYPAAPTPPPLLMPPPFAPIANVAPSGPGTPGFVPGASYSAADLEDKQARLNAEAAAGAIAARQLSSAQQELARKLFEAGASAGEALKFLKAHQLATDDDRLALDRFRKDFVASETERRKVSAAMAELTVAERGYQGVLESVDGTTIEAVKYDLEHKATVSEIAHTYSTALAPSIGEAEAKIRVIQQAMKDEAKDAKDLTKVLAEVHKVEAGRGAVGLEKVGLPDQGVGQTKEYVTEYEHNLGLIDAATAKSDQAIERMSEQTADYQIAQVRRWQDVQEGLIDYGAANWQQAYDAIGRAADDQIRAIIAKNDPIDRAWKALNTDVRQQWADTWTQALATHQGFVAALLSPFNQLQQEWQHLLGALVAEWEGQFLAKLGFHFPGVEPGGAGSGAANAASGLLSQLLPSLGPHASAAPIGGAATGYNPTGSVVGSAAAEGGEVAGPGVAGAMGIGAGFAGSLATAGITMGLSFAVTGAVALLKHLFRDRMPEDIARDAGAKFGQVWSDSLQKSIQANAKQFHDEVAGEIASLPEIIAEHPITTANLDMYMGKVHDIFSMLQTGKFTADQATAELDKIFPQLTAAATDSYGFISDKLKEIIRLDQQFGTQSKAIADFLKQQGSAALEGFNAVAGALTEQLSGSAMAGTGWDEIKKNVDDTRSAIKSTGDATDAYVGIIGKMGEAERTALDEGFDKAKIDGFKGTLVDFFKVQATLAQTAPAGATPSSIFSTSTIAAIKAQASAASDQITDVINKMGTDERTALVTAYTTEISQGFKGTLSEFLLQQNQLYTVAQEGDARLKTWLSGETAAQLNGIDAVQKYNAALKAQQEAAAAAKQGLDDLGTIGLATFGAAIASGQSFADALKAAQPGLKSLSQAYQDLGLDVDNVAVKALLIQSHILDKNPQLLTAVSGLGQSFAALSNMGLLNVDTFQAMQRTGMSMYTRLQAEAAAAGGSTRDALVPMQDYLHQAQKAAEDLGVPLDDNTQMLINQSKELGIWQDKGKTATDKLTDGMQSLVDKLNEFLDRLAGVPPKVTTEIDTKYTSSGGPGQPPPGPTSSPSITGYDDNGNPIYAAEGGVVRPGGLAPLAQYFDQGGVAQPTPFVPKGPDVVPAMVRVGEMLIPPDDVSALVTSVTVTKQSIRSLSDDFTSLVTRLSEQRARLAMPSAGGAVGNASAALGDVLEAPRYLPDMATTLHPALPGQGADSVLVRAQTMADRLREVVSTFETERASAGVEAGQPKPSAGILQAPTTGGHYEGIDWNQHWVSDHPGFVKPANGTEQMPGYTGGITGYMPSPADSGTPASSILREHLTAQTSAVETHTTSIDKDTDRTKEQTKATEDAATTTADATTALQDLALFLSTDLTASIDTVRQAMTQVNGQLHPAVMPGSVVASEPIAPGLLHGGMVSSTGIRPLVQYFTEGGFVDTDAHVVTFKPKGSDVVPAMLSVGELVIPAPLAPTVLQLLAAVGPGTTTDTGAMAAGLPATSMAVQYFDDGGIVTRISARLPGVSSTAPIARPLDGAASAGFLPVSGPAFGSSDAIPSFVLALTQATSAVELFTRAFDVGPLVPAPWQFLKGDDVAAPPAPRTSSSNELGDVGMLVTEVRSARLELIEIRRVLGLPHDTVVQIGAESIVRATNRVYDDNPGGLRTQTQDFLGIPRR